MKKLCSLFVAAFALACSFGAQAAGSGSGVVSYMIPLTSGLVFFEMSANGTGTPSCASSTPNRFVVDGSTAAGKAQISSLQIAFALGKTVYWYGTGTCSLYSLTETLDYPKVLN